MSSIAIITFLAVASILALLVLAFDFGSSSAQLRKRARLIGTRSGTGRAIRSGPGAAASMLKRDEGRSVPVLEALVRRFLPRQSALRDRLGRTGYNLTIGVYALFCLTVTAGGFVAARLFLGLVPALAGCLAITVGLGVPHLIVTFLISRYRAKFLANFPDAVDLIVRGLKAGLPVGESISAVAHEMSWPISTEFQTITDSVRFGRPLEDVLWDTARRLDIPEFNFFAISLSIQRETGGNLAETLTNLSDILRRRRQIQLKIRALSSEAKVSAYVLGALPFVMFGLISGVNPGYANTLFTDPRGVIMLSVGLTSIATGGLIIFKMIRFEI